MPLQKAERFLALGLDSQAAEQLLAKSFSPTSLRKASVGMLAALGLDEEAKAKLKRPPIPPETLFRVLQKAKRICCICRTGGSPIVVHHIVEWHVSNDHSENNLVVVCPTHHTLAHTKSTMSQNLTPAMVRRHKAAWEEEVRIAAAHAVVGLSKVSGANWDYINLQRIFRLADTLQINLQKMPKFDELQHLLMDFSRR